MKSTLSATHLLRHLVLFLFTVIFLLTMIRAAYVLWQFPTALESGALLEIFIMGLRYDLALAGILLLPVGLLGSLLGMFNITRGLGKFIVATLLILGMLFVLLSELITPYFLIGQNVRPDLLVLSSVTDPIKMLADLWSAYMIPAVIGVVLTVLIMIAYIARLETDRLMRYRFSRLSALLLFIVAPLACVFAIYSGIYPMHAALSPTTGLLSTETVINEIALNTGYKTLYSMVQPLLPNGL